MERQQLENKRNILSDISDITAPRDLPQLRNNFLCISGSWISISINHGQPPGLYHHLVSPAPGLSPELDTHVPSPVATRL